MGRIERRSMFKTHGFVANWQLCPLVHVLSGGLVLDQLSWTFDRQMSRAAKLVHGT